MIKQGWDGQVEALVSWKRWLEEQAERVILRYMSMDVIKQRTEFQSGKWNNQLVWQVQVNTLIQLFPHNGVDRFLLMKVILLVVAKGDLKENMYMIEYSLTQQRWHLNSVLHIFHILENVWNIVY